MKQELEKKLKDQLSKRQYFRDGSIGLKQFQEMELPQQKEHLDYIQSLPVEQLDFRDAYIITFYEKIFYPNRRKEEENKMFITMEQK